MFTILLSLLPTLLIAFVGAAIIYSTIAFALLFDVHQ